MKSYKDMMVTCNEDIKNHLLLSKAKLIKKQEDDIFCTTIIKLINEKKMLLTQQYVLSEEKLLHKAVRKEDEYFHALVVP